MWLIYVQIYPSLSKAFSSARVVQWLDHLGAMCSRAWRAQCAAGPEFKSEPRAGKVRPPT